MVYHRVWAGAVYSVHLIGALAQRCSRVALRCDAVRCDAVRCDAWNCKGREWKEVEWRERWRASSIAGASSLSTALSYRVDRKETNKQVRKPNGAWIDFDACLFPGTELSDSS